MLAWIAADVRKESVAELGASGLSWAQVEKPVRCARGPGSSAVLLREIGDLAQELHGLVGLDDADDRSP